MKNQTYIQEVSRIMSVTVVLCRMDRCKNNNTVGMTQTFISKIVKTAGPSVEKCLEHISDVVNKGTKFAVWSDDADHEYYLVHAETGSYVLENDETDACGLYWKSGTNVIKGKYYENTSAMSLQYKLIKEHPAFVPSLSVVFIIESS